MKQIVYQGKLYSEFNGFDQDAIFKMSNGTYWVQARYKYWYHYAYRPDVTIVKENGQYFMNVAGQSVQVRRLYNVIESNVDGAFEGWDGEKVYKLRNGQIWRQRTYKYEYKYAYCPEAIVVEVNGMYIMQVEGTQAEVERIR